jgi:hypothetical protein
MQKQNCVSIFTAVYHPTTLTLLCLHWRWAHKVPSRTLVNMHIFLEFLILIFDINYTFEYTNIYMTHEGLKFTFVHFNSVPLSVRTRYQLRNMRSLDLLL